MWEEELDLEGRGGWRGAGVMGQWHWENVKVG